jgi:hypothetical protein
MIVLSSLSTPLATVLTDALVYSLGNMMVKVGVNPVQEMSELRGQIAEDLTYYANNTTSPGAASEEERTEVGEAYREKASLLMAKMHKIPYYKFWEILGLVPEKSDVMEAHSDLIWLSNAVPSKKSSGSYERMDNIKSKLGLNAE